MGIGWSIHKNGLFLGQYERMLRWRERVAQASSKSPADVEDFTYTAFQNCYYLRDWILKTSDVPRADLDALFKRSSALRVCRDICNGTKHFTITSPSVDADFSILREYEPSVLSRQRLFIIADGEKHDLLDLLDDAIQDWKTFFGVVDQA